MRGGRDSCENQDSAPGQSPNFFERFIASQPQQSQLGSSRKLDLLSSTWKMGVQLRQGKQSVTRSGGIGGHRLEGGILYSSEDGWEILSSIAKNFLSLFG